jgi:hemin uptake protein HemP
MCLFLRGPAGEAAVFAMVTIMNEPPPTRPHDSAAPQGHTTSTAAARESWRSEELLGDRPEVLILHNNEVYRLRRTRQGKLILHK